MHLTNSDAKIYVAGHRGMVGAAIWDELEAAGYQNLVGRSSAELDLRDPQATRAFFEAEEPDFVVLAAARVGGILANDRYPADFIGDNLAIEQSVIRAAHETSVERLIFLGSTCIYPKRADQPMPEESLLTGPLEPTNQWYAVAKIAGHKLCEAFCRQHGDDMLTLMPTNLYGPGDDFDLETSHVLPALLRKAHEAKGARSDGSDAPVTLWGSGEPRREFLYVEDLADAVRFVLETPEEEIREVAADGMLNVGVGEDLSINELMALIQGVVGHEGAVEHDRSKPDGTPRKLVDTSRMDALGWTADTSLRAGIEKTYNWYREHEEELIAA
ncbi:MULTISPECIES: GDP-L-fucose synthase family protein [Salinibacter]|uniref:GDP-L-fucose synthase family protein n=1 Tax=Salinibacter TaxID=146918 RepID=UPI002169FCB2|nr:MULTISPECIES: GDP-L-fucose synthase [Salinibacter]MCS3665240.1 GDP-L-fucose synthase [Salinibacter ruber]MCS3756103.1 GDP-L-fucose synthase [Salinibacter ruber]MCS4040874.1 GDP-L-fucose synthase [Salinibacter ruber]MCS4223254.1 GDP-L-fucose synthase [Salinibacter ruber]